ncbi:hypothetical protein [Pacificoceanicola onchidii]|uniref:hypothetical protein n=1 Tax=Pacificoceanicola onchidii TaxID=2562685 RepID=UPI0010A36CC6|nr:hypothetical protein [Pacificoceanicola onchidii]
MSDTPGLSVPLNVKLQQFERQLARVDALATKSAKSIQDKYEQANGRVANSFAKSAEASAQVFERAIQKETRAFQRLKASVDPAYAAQRRYEAAVRQVEAAVRMGAVSQKEANAVLEQARAAHLGAGLAATAAAGQAGGFFNVSRQGRAVLMNTTNQVSDMFVQWEMGTNVMRIAGMQLPQMLSGFGMLGGTLGVIAPILATIAAIGFPVAAFLLAAGDNAEESAAKVKTFADAFGDAESAINSASAAVGRAAKGDLEDLQSAYGAVTQEVKNLIEALARLEVEKALVATRTAVDKFFEDNSGAAEISEALEKRNAMIEETQSKIAELQASPLAGSTVVVEQVERLQGILASLEDTTSLAEHFKISPEVLTSIHDAQEALNAARQAGDMGQIAEAIADLRAALGDANADLGKLSDQLAEAEDLARRTDNQVQRLATSAGTVNFDAATASAARMADEINRAVDALYELRAQGLTDLETAQIRYEYRDDPIGRAGALAGAEFDRRTSAVWNAAASADPDALASYDRQRAEAVETAREIARLNEASRPKRKSGGGRSGRTGGGKAKAEAFDLFANSEAEITALERQIEMIGKSAKEVAFLTAKYELLDAAKDKNIDLDQRSADTGKTVREEIDAQAEAIANLTIKAEQYAAQQEFMNDLTEELQDGLIDAIVEGENFADVLADVAKALAKAALQAALFGKGPLAGAFGGGEGLLGSLFGGGKGGGLSFFAKGTDYAPGGAAMVGEDGPELVHLPRGSKVVPNHRLSQGGGRSQVDVFVHPSGEFDTRVQRISGDVATTVSGQMISQNNRSFSELQRR